MDIYTSLSALPVMEGPDSEVLDYHGVSRVIQFNNNNSDPTWDLVPSGVNVYFLVDELYSLVVKTIRKYSF